MTLTGGTRSQNSTEPPKEWVQMNKTHNASQEHSSIGQRECWNIKTNKMLEPVNINENDKTVWYQKFWKSEPEWSNCFCNWC